MTFLDHTLVFLLSNDRLGGQPKTFFLALVFFLMILVF